VNLDDGRVEVVAAGDAKALDALAHWLRHGPPNARVDRVERDAIDPGTVGQGFGTG
jgi:acylphosphatase